MATKAKSDKTDAPGPQTFPANQAPAGKVDAVHAKDLPGNVPPRDDGGESPAVGNYVPAQDDSTYESPDWVKDKQEKDS